MSPEQIAAVAHEANRALTVFTKDVPLQPHWGEATMTKEMETSAIAGVKWRLANLGAPASAAHEQWLMFKADGGWKWGPVRSDELKTHPAMIPYDKLPPEVQAKDALFTAIVRALA